MLDSMRKEHNKGDKTKNEMGMPFIVIITLFLANWTEIFNFCYEFSTEYFSAQDAQEIYFHYLVFPAAEISLVLQ